MKELPIIISAVSLLVSLYTLWVTRMAKFKLEVAAVSRVDLASNPQSLGAKQPAIILQLLFTNRGARLGYVNDVAISLQKTGSDQQPVVFRSLFEDLEDTLNLTSQLPAPKFTTSKSFPIKASETIAKRIVFVPRDPQDDIKFEEASYLVTPFTRDSRSEGWEGWRDIQFEVVGEDLQALKRTRAVPTPGGGQFVAWMVHSKPTRKTEEELQSLENSLIHR